MTEPVVFLAAGVVFLALIPLAPKLIRLRIAVFRWLHWNWFADLFEQNFLAFNRAIQAILLVAGLTLLVLGLSRL